MKTYTVRLRLKISDVALFIFRLLVLPLISREKRIAGEDQEGDKEKKLPATDNHYDFGIDIPVSRRLTGPKDYTRVLQENPRCYHQKDECCPTKRLVVRPHFSTFGKIT